MKSFFLNQGRWLLAVMLAATMNGLGAGTGSAAENATPDPAGSRLLDLSQCVQIALGSSVSLAIAHEQREQAADDVTAAWGAFLPSLSASRNFYKGKSTDFDLQVGEGTYMDYVQRYSQISHDLQANLNLFSGLSKFKGLSAAKNSRRAYEASEMYSRELVVQNVACAYYDLLRYEKLFEVTEESRELAARELQKSETYFRLGSAAKSDVLQARVRLEQTKLEVVRAQNSVAQAFADLAYAMNQPLAERFEIDRSPLQTDFELEALGALYSEALQNRLDLTSQEYTGAARRGDVWTASANLLPQVDLFASYARDKSDLEWRFGAERSARETWGYNISWNLFDRMVTWTNRSKAKANVRIAEYNLAQAKLDVQLEIRQLYNLLVEARERANHSRETIIQSQEELRLAQERFRVGAGTTLDRITAEVNLAQARVEEVQAICDFLINTIKLNRAVGRSLDFTGSGR